MTLRFTKMHGLGNDFMVLDLVHQQVTLTPALIKQWSNRFTGVGFDQLLVLESTHDAGCDFAYRIYNADGGEVEHCGNGARCITRFAIEKGLTNKQHLVFAMARGTIETRLENDGLVTVDMRPPVLAPAAIPFVTEQQAATYPLTVAGQQFTISAVSMGNPHCVLVVDAVDAFPVQTLGPQIEHHPAFPERVNAGFMQMVSRTEIKLRVFERGTGETQACGTGACAAVVAGRLRGLLDERVLVHALGGDMTITWAGDNTPVWKTGPAVSVFDGELTLAP
jgi:diaminopimelate epimerase